jgi:hypothetical protein
VHLFHATGEDEKAGIESDGFRVSHVLDCQGHSCFADTREGAVATARARTWLIVVEITDELAEAHRFLLDDDEPYPGVYRLPFEVVNALAPFSFERITVG